MGGSASKEQRAAVVELKAMGFPEAAAIAALEACEGDVVRATEMLLSQPPPATVTTENSLLARPVLQPASATGGGGGAVQARDIADRERARNEAALRMALEQSMNDAPAVATPAPAPAPAPAVLTEEEMLRMAMEASMKDATPHEPAPSAQPARQSEEDMIAEAIRQSMQLSPAERREGSPCPGASRVVSGTVEPLARQIEKHAASLAGHPTTVDTLIAVLQMILEHPDDPQYRRLRLSNRKFRATVAGAPGGIELLLALGFVRDSSQGAEALLLRRCDAGVLWLGKASLEQCVAGNPEYQRARGVLERQEAAVQEQKLFHQTLEQSKASADAEELARRAQWLRKVPPENSAVQNAVVKILMGEQKHQRRFATDEVLSDVVNFLGSLHSEAPARLADGRWELWDLTTQPPKKLDCCGEDGPKTLYELMLWPAATINVTPRGWDVTAYYKKMGWGYS